MKNILAGFLFISALTLARADFTSYTLISQSDPLTYDPLVSYTFDSLTINMTGNTPAGDGNFTVDDGFGATIQLSFTDTASIVGDSVELLWFYPNSSSIFESFPSIIVPGTVDANFGAGDFTITGDTVTIVNTTQGWSPASFNGFEILDLTQQVTGPTGGGVPDASSTLLLLGVAMGGLAICSRRAMTVKRHLA